MKQPSWRDRFTRAGMLDLTYQILKSLSYQSSPSWRKPVLTSEVREQLLKDERVVGLSMCDTTNLLDQLTRHACAKLVRRDQESCALNTWKPI